MNKKQLSKSKLVSFMQCPKRMWLELNSDIEAKYSSSAALRMEVGHQVGEIARKLADPENKGVLLDSQREGLETVFQRTTELLQSAQPIFEAGLRTDIGQCPPIGQSPSCGALITINPNGSLKIQVDSSVPPYDGVEDSIIGVINNSGASVYGIKLSGSGIFGFDGDGAFGGSYSNSDISFNIQDANTGIVNFTNPNGLENGKFAYFSLEGSPTAIKLTSTITLDPGHGTTCAAVSQAVGAVGSKIYPASNPPPGPLMEDSLTVDVASQLGSLLAGDSFDVKLTKGSVSACPTFLERTKIANDARSNLFVSIHFDAPATGLTGLLKFPGSLGIYNSAKSSAATLAQLVANNTSASLGISNRGTKVDNSLAVLKTTTSRMTAIIIETARLSSPDDDVIHASGGTTRAANGIRAGINAFINQ